MWHLIALLLCLGAASCGSSQCTCNMEESFFHFVIQAEVSSKEEAEGNLIAYGIKETTMIRPLNHKNFGEMVYTNDRVDNGRCGVTLEVGKRYILKGIFGENNKPTVTSCGVLEICSSDSEKKN